MTPNTEKDALEELDGSKVYRLRTNSGPGLVSQCVEVHVPESEEADNAFN